MKKKYNKSIIILFILTIICLIIYFLTYSKYDIISNIFCNMSIGFITGFVILVITNQKNTFIYKNKIKIDKIRKILEESREYEIKIINYGALNEIPIIELIYIYADLCNLLTSINELDNNYFNIYKYDLESIIKDYDNNLEKLSEVTYLVNINKKEYEEYYSKDLSKKMVIIYKLRSKLRSDLEALEKDNETLNTSLL